MRMYLYLVELRSLSKGDPPPLARVMHALMPRLFPSTQSILYALTLIPLHPSVGLSRNLLKLCQAIAKKAVGVAST